MDEKSKRLRKLTWDDYGISKERYRELRYFCLQYAEKKKKAAQCTDYGISGIKYDSVGGHSSNVSSPAENNVIRGITKQERYLRDVRMINEAAIWAATISGFPKAWNVLLWSVTRDYGYDRLCQRYNFVPWCKPDFYAVRRAFFSLLNDLQNGTKNTLPRDPEIEKK